jgi:hypothetical protein
MNAPSAIKSKIMILSIFSSCILIAEYGVHRFLTNFKNYPIGDKIFFIFNYGGIAAFALCITVKIAI